MYWIIDGKAVQTREDVYNTAVRAMSPPEWFGRNLDALWDLLTDLCDPLTVVVIETDLLREHLGSFADTLLKLLAQAAERENITLIVDR